MAKSKQSFDRLQRERAKKAKADAKRERRLSKDDEPSTDDEDAVATGGAASQDAVLKELEQLHAAFDDEQISFDDFEAKRAELLSRLQVD